MCDIEDVVRKINVFIMGYVTFSLGCYMVCCFCRFISGRLYIF